MEVKAFVSGCAGTRLSAEEASFFGAEQPWGLILFQRNCAHPEEIRDLVAGFRHAVGRIDAPVLIDQEGGRVQRLKPPVWRAYPPCGILGAVAEQDGVAGEKASWLQGRLIAADLLDLGITVDCAPDIDLRFAGTTSAIGNRAFGAEPELVTRLGRAYANGLMAGGVLPVIKHCPGHGRATVDSHHSLPVVGDDLETLAATDFVPFARLADLPLAMTGHIVFTAIDADNPATTSAVVIRDIIRGRISFDGLLLSDDVSMKALSGDFAAKTRAIHAAGCDIVLYCFGVMDEMRAVAAAARPLDGVSARRARAALDARRQPEPFDVEAGWEEFQALIERAGRPATV
ncbi:MAG: beta-N-acetylhexosaminidase [Bauldia sp.]